MPILNELNEQQQRAVTQTEGPVLVLAGAGSGKTKTLTARLAYLMQEKKVRPSHILAVTFTNKAAGEMAARLRRETGQNEPMPWLGTFHRLGVKLLRQELDRSDLPLSRWFTIYDSDDSRTLVKHILRDWQVDPKRYNPRVISSLISSAKNELVSIDEYTTLAVGPMQQLAARVYVEYQRRLEAANALDFDDLLVRVLELFRRHPDVLERYQEQFEYILVDEYQDTNKVQYLIIKELAAKRQNIFVVGDDWQSIYGFRGADFRNILNFTQDYPHALVVKLERNYRSTQNILDAADAIIKQARQRSDKVMVSDAERGEPVTIVECFNDRSESEFVVKEARARLNKTDALTLEDMAVLYRTNAQSRVLEETFLRRNLPYRIVGGVRFYARKEVKDAVAYVRLLGNAEDRVSFERVANVPSRGVGPKSLQQYWAAVESGSVKLPAKVADFLESLERLRHETTELTPGEAVVKVLELSGLKKMYNDGTVEGESRWENLVELARAAEAFASINEWLEQVALMEDADETVEKGGTGLGSITLMTVHAAKGLEFDTVFIVGLEESLFPHANSLQDDLALEEERRLAYVGMTRAKQRLYLLYANERRVFGAATSNLPSRFLREVPARVTEDRQF
jgi:DNA helicase-2/ATP-dependent DNA helicase PcrA